MVGSVKEHAQECQRGRKQDTFPSAGGIIRKIKKTFRGLKEVCNLPKVMLSGTARLEPVLRDEGVD